METKVLKKPDFGLLKIPKIQRRIGQMPKKYRKIYINAVIHKNKNAAIKAFCLECVCWQKDEIIHCTSLACPLYGLRPYTKEEDNEEE